MEDCKEVNKVTYCYCSTPLCNTPDRLLSSPNMADPPSAFHASNDDNSEGSGDYFSSDDEDYADEDDYDDYHYDSEEGFTEPPPSTKEELEEEMRRLQEMEETARRMEEEYRRRKQQEKDNSSRDIEFEAEEVPNQKSPPPRSDVSGGQMEVANLGLALVLASMVLQWKRIWG